MSFHFKQMCKSIFIWAEMASFYMLLFNLFFKQYSVCIFSYQYIHFSGCIIFNDTAAPSFTLSDPYCRTFQLFHILCHYKQYGDKCVHMYWLAQLAYFWDIFPRRTSGQMICMLKIWIHMIRLPSEKACKMHTCHSKYLRRSISHFNQQWTSPVF